MMIRSKEFVTSKHVELPFNQTNFLFSLIRIIERGKNGFVSLIKGSWIQALLYFHLLYNVCYHSMAKSENGPESGNPDHSLSATLMVNENSENDEVISSENECVHDESRTRCEHVEIAFDSQNVARNSIITLRTGIWKCLSCGSGFLSDLEGKDLSVCLTCSQCFCTDHIKEHSETVSSKPHILFCKAGSWSVRCLVCDIDIPPNNGLKVTVDSLKTAYIRGSRMQSAKSARAESLTSVSDNFNRNNDVSNCLSITVASKSTSSLLPPQGLNNLGNTCFFNSVLQCLARTPYLLELLLEMKEPVEKTALMIDNNTKLEFTLGKWGPVTEALASTLLQLTQRSGGSFSPLHLLDALRKKHSQFQGYNQHDAHELLRTLLDCVKTEDIRRYQNHLMKHFGLIRSNKEEIDEKKVTLVRELSKRLADTVNIIPDPVFRGITVSRNQCTKCLYKSEIPESFLDLSLPVSFLKLAAPSIVRKKNDFVEKPKSKHQKKKEMRAAKKNKKLARIKKRSDGFIVAESSRNKNMDTLATEMKDIIESGYSSEKALSPTETIDDLIVNDNSNEIMLAEALNEINATSPEVVNEDNNVSTKLNSNTDSPSSDTVYGDVVTAFGGDTASESSLMASENMETSSDRFSENGVQAPEMRFCLVDPVTTLPETMNSFKSSSSEEDKDEDDDVGDDDNEENDVNGSEDESADENFLDASEIKTRKTLLPPTEDEENSILACLREYTKCEILTGNNKVICEKCTKEHEKKTGDKKPVYQTFSKELLIKSPPPVLILHLKRFESKGAFSFRKVDKPISFPLLLDIGSFCSISCEKLLYPDQKNIMYSLYGVVEHSGSLNAGHYVAYVKVRKQVNENSYRKLFLPENMCKNCERVNKEDFNKILYEHKNAERQWYYISDSSVRSISEEDVLRKEAYLLFYERIL